MTDTEDLIFKFEEVFLYGLIVFCFVAPALLTVLNVLNLILRKKVIPKTSAMLTVWLGGAMYAILLTVFCAIYPDAVGGFAVLFPAAGVLGIFILLIAAWNYPKERLVPSTVRVFRIAFIAANLLHLAFAVILLLNGADNSIYLFFYVYHINLVLVSVSACGRKRSPAA